MHIDTAAIRRTANQLKTLSNNIKDQVNSKIKSVQNESSGTFEGASADVMQQELSDLRQRTSHACSRLTDLANELRAYAREVEAADRAAAAKIKET